MNIILETKKEFIRIMLENKLNEQGNYMVFNIPEKMGNCESPNQYFPVFLKFMQLFNETKSKAEDERKQIILEGFSDFLSNANMSFAERAFIDWYVVCCGFVGIRTDIEDKVYWAEDSLPVVGFSPDSDFWKDLKSKLDFVEKKLSEDYLRLTYDALNSDGYYVGNFKAKTIVPVPLSGRKLNLEDILKTCTEYCNDEENNETVESMMEKFSSGEIAFCKKDHPFLFFANNHAENQQSN